MITLSTMHSAKGKEWTYVLLFADDNVSFPSFRTIQNYLIENIPEADIRESIDENRRLHYVAMTRAKMHLVIFASATNLSVYTLESLGVMDFGKDNDRHIISMAQHGVYRELVESAQEVIFSNESVYHMDLDIKELKTPIELLYEAKQVNEAAKA